MCDGRRFQADGAATEKELLESWRLNRGTIKSLECNTQKNHTYNGRLR